MRSEPARLGEISLDFADIPPSWDENFPYDHAQVGHPGKVGYHFFQSFLFYFSEFNLILQERLFCIMALRHLIVKKTWSNNLFPAT